MAAHQLYLISLGRLIDQNPSPGVEAESQVPAYLIRSARGKNILIDTGSPIALVGAENAAPWAPKLGTRITGDDDIVVQLAKLGLRPKDIDLLVTTHFDFDHCGRHDLAGADRSRHRCQLARRRRDLTARPSACRGDLQRAVGVVGLSVVSSLPSSVSCLQLVPSSGPETEDRSRETESTDSVSRTSSVHSHRRT